MTCAKCKSIEGFEVFIYPYGYRNKKPNLLPLCSVCLSLLRPHQARMKTILRDVEKYDACLCCEEPYKSDYEAAASKVDEFFSTISLTENQRKYAGK